MIADFVFGELSDMNFFTEINTKYKKTVFLETLHRFSLNISGEYALTLKNIYHQLNLDSIVLKYCRSRKWHYQVYGLRIIGDFSDLKHSDLVLKALQSKSKQVSIQAELSMIKLYPQTPLQFLDNFDDPLSDWAQINLLSALENTPEVVIPSFAQWYGHRQPSVAIFAIRMTATFKQKENVLKLAEMVVHPNETLRNEVYLALENCDDSSVIPIVKERFQDESDANKIAILKILSKFDDASSCDFLINLLKTEENSHIQFHIAESLCNLRRDGISAIAEFAMSCKNPALKSGISYLLKIQNQ